MPAPANPPSKSRQDEFALSVKTALLHKNQTISDLARDLGLNRNTVSLAINRGLYAPTRDAIAKHLGIRL